MTSAHTSSLVALLRRADKNGTVPRGWDGSLADRLRELLRAQESDLKEASNALREAFQEHMTALDEKTRDELLDAHSSEDISGAKQAYRLGQLSFANLVVSQAASRRATQEFKQMLVSPTHRQCIEAMYYGEKTTTELAKLSGKRIEPTSRNLSILRKIGIAEFRKVATQTYNFLTPIAQQTFKAILDEERKQLSEEASPCFIQEAHEALAQVLNKMPKPFREAPSFSASISNRSPSIV